MDQTRGIDRSKPVGDKMIDFLMKRFEAPHGVVGGEVQYFKKVAMGLISLASDHYYHHPNEATPYVED